MTLEEFIAEIRRKLPPAPLEKIAAFERNIGSSLPEDYREFLIQCNGGYLGGRLCFYGNDGQEETIIHHILGFREESHFSLEWAREILQGEELRLPLSLIKIMDDPGGNAICLGITEDYRGKVYFWDHEEEPGEDWDGDFETAGNLSMLADSFSHFVAGIKFYDDEADD